MTTNAQANIGVPADAEILKRVKFSPAEAQEDDVLSVGEALCYIIEDGVVDMTQVARPATATLRVFAGIVHPSSAGATDGDHITLIAQGPATVRVDGATGDAVSIGDRLNVVDGSYNLRHSDANDDGFCVAYQGDGLTADDEQILAMVGQQYIILSP